VPAKVTSKAAKDRCIKELCTWTGKQGSRCPESKGDAGDEAVSKEMKESEAIIKFLKLGHVTANLLGESMEGGTDEAVCSKWASKHRDPMELDNGIQVGC
jgi:hypothetical protein